MSKLEEIMKQIGELRASMIKIKEGRSFTDPEIIIASQMLEAVFLRKYQEMLMQTYSIADDGPDHLVEVEAGNIKELQNEEREMIC